MTPPKIDAYRFGRMVIDGKTYTKDVIILPSRIISGWRRAQGHALHVEDLAAVFAAEPDTLVVGQGAQAMMRITQDARDALARRGIELIAAPSGDAWETYNHMREQRSVAGAFHLTC